MKKLLSILLALCMIFSMFIFPANAVETVDNTYEHYWSFDFSKENIYTDYANPVNPDGTSYDFAAKSNNVAEIGYGNLNGKDALYVRTNTNNNGMFVPLQADGTPVVLEAGKQYVVKWDFSVTRGAGAWCRPHIEPYTRLDGAITNASDGVRYNAYYTDDGGKKVLLQYATGTMNGYAGLYAGPQLAYWNAGFNMVANASDDVTLQAYDKATSGSVNTFTARTDTQYNNGTSATGCAYSYTQTLTMQSDDVLANTYNVSKNADGSYTFNGVNYNNLLALSLPGGYGFYYYPGKDEKATSNLQDAEGNWYHNAYGEYYITGLTVYEVGVGSVVLDDGNGNVTTHKGTPGETVALSVPTAPAGKYFAGWYTDKALTKLHTSATVTIAEGAPTKLYAGYKTYLTSTTNDWSTKALAQTAINNNGTLEVPFVSGDTYYAQTNGGGWAAVDATDSGIKNYPKAVDGKPAGTITVGNTTLNGRSLSPFVLQKLNDSGATVNTTNTKSFGDGTYATSGWGETSFVTVYREDGTPFVAKPNTTYNITLTYKVEHFADGWQDVGVTTGSFAVASIGYSKANAANWATTTNNKELVNKGSYIYYHNATDDFVTETFSVASGAADFVPVVGVTLRGFGVIGKKTDQVDGNGFPIYQVIDAPAITIKEIKVEEVAAVTFNYVGGSTSKVGVSKGQKIEYPELTTPKLDGCVTNEYDAVWSLSANEYIPVPEVSDGTALNVYELRRTNKMSFESYNQSYDYVNNKWLTNAMVTDEIAYEGNKSMKYENTNLNVLTAAPSDWTTNYAAYYSYDAETDTFSKLTSAPTFEANKYYKTRISSEVEQGMFMVKGLGAYGKYTYNYKITFKYYVPEDMAYNVNITTKQISTGNIWGGGLKDLAGTFVIDKKATGGWKTGVLSVSATDLAANTYGGQAIAFIAKTPNVTYANARDCVVYFDDIVCEENVSKVTYHYNNGANDKVVSTTAGAAYTIDAAAPTAPEGMVFDGWYTSEDFAADTLVGSSITMPTTGVLSVDLYAKFVEPAKVIYHHNDGVTEDKVVTDGIVVGTNNIAYVPATAPAGKYFMGWYTNEALTVSAGTTFTVPNTDTPEAHLYAKWGNYADYTEGKTYTLSVAAKKGFAVMNGETYLQDYNFKEGSGWDSNSTGTAGYVKIGKNPTGSIAIWNPSKTTGVDQTSSTSQMIAYEQPGVVGEVSHVGWGVTGNYTLRDENGQVMMAKPNTKYAAVLNYEIIGHGTLEVTLNAGRKLAKLDNVAEWYNAGTFHQYTSNAMSLMSGSYAATVADKPKGENHTYTFHITTGNFTDSVPVFSLHYSVSGAMGRRLADDGNGLESYEAGGKTYYPYEYVDYPEIRISSITLIEIGEGEGAATYTSYEKGTGYETAIAVGQAGANAYKETGNPDSNWYLEKITQYPVLKSDVVYGNGNAINYYNADYMMVPEYVVSSETNFFGTQMEKKYTEKDGVDVPAIYYNSIGYDEYMIGKDPAVDTNINSHVKPNATDAEKLAEVKDHYNKSTQVFRMGKAVDGHTYKVSFSIKADKFESNMGVHFAAGIANNIWGTTTHIAAYNDITTAKVVAGDTWYDFTYYVTYDAAGYYAAVDGIDDTKSSVREFFYVWFSQDITAHDLTGCDNEIYIADIVYEDLGVAVGENGASILNSDAMQTATSQAMRFYFNYATEDGSTIKLGDEEYTVVARGFIYQNGAIGKYTAADGKYTGFSLNTAGVKKSSVKKDNFDECWEYADGVMTFSTYVKGFTEALYDSKLIVRGYVTFVDANGKEHTVYSDTVNRSVNGIDLTHSAK